MVVAGAVPLSRLHRLEQLPQHRPLFPVQLAQIQGFLDVNLAGMLDGRQPRVDIGRALAAASIALRLGAVSSRMTEIR